MYFFVVWFIAIPPPPQSASALSYPSGRCCRSPFAVPAKNTLLPPSVNPIPLPYSPPSTPSIPTDLFFQSASINNLHQPSSTRAVPTRASSATYAKYLRSESLTSNIHFTYLHTATNAPCDIGNSSRNQKRNRKEHQL